MESSDVSKIKRQKWHCITTKYVHRMRRALLTRRIRFVDWLAVAVPLVYVPMRYLVKGTEWGALTEHTWEMLSATLLVLAVTKIIFKWQEDVETHSELIGENISVIKQADAILSKSSHLSPKAVQEFLFSAEQLGEKDNKLLGEISKKESQRAHIRGLKEIGENCDWCKASPWDFKQGDCPICGNTPIASN